jgi:hypothetical protein
MGKVVERLFSVAAERTSMDRLGFAGDAALRQRLEGVSRTFLAGYHAALAEDGEGEELTARLEGAAEERWLRGFAFEGAGFGFAVRDVLSPWRRTGRLGRFLGGAGSAYVHLVHVGAGWAIPRARVPWGWLRRRLDPELAWLAIDGYGFHEGFFRYAERVGRGRWPRRVSGYARSAFDQGLGRCLWFGEVAEPERIARRIEGLAPARRNDLWSGVGLAATYAGGVGAEGLERLAELAGPYRWALGQGSTFAATARRLDASVAPEHDVACTILCGLPAAEAAALTDRVHERLPAAGTAERPRFELWRRGIQQELAAAEAAA